MNRIDRLTGMILLLQNHRVITAERVAEHFEISVRTVYRDLAALGEAGVPILAEAGVGYSLMRGYHVPPVMFTEDEVAALFMSGEVTEQVADDSLRGALRSALLKVRSVLPRERHELLNRLQPAIGVWLRPNEDGEDRPDCLMPLQQAVVRKRCVLLDYDAGGRGEVSQREVEPLGLMYYARQWHLIAFCRLRSDFRDFRLDRISHWAITTQTFEGHEGFSVKEFLSEAIGRHELVPVKARFHASAMERVRREMRCASVRECPGPFGWMEVDMLAYSLEWHASWLLQFGKYMEVVEPVELRALIHTLAHDLA
ncbi:MAG TPA: YafY family protein, partial [Verrucomicrobium sp.]|nr:YafY family protein [Verrucomicrobium sp.]